MTVVKGETATSVIVVGAGLVGTLLAIMLARRGCRVDVYERLPDPRTIDRSIGRSINLTLCTRGFAALDHAAVGEVVRARVVPVRGRMLHQSGKTPLWLPYGPNNEALFAIARSELSEVLLSQAERVPGVSFHFGHVCTELSLEDLRVELINTATGQRVSRTDAFIVGADGAFSTVRLWLQQQYHFDYSQEYSSSSYVELPIIPSDQTSWTARRDALHLWPRGRSMLLAIPNRNGTFTGTLLLPTRGPESRETLTTEPTLLAFMREHFPDVLAHVPNLADTYLSTRPIPLVTIRCNPWSHRGRILLVGDAAHAIFPSYGQGANAGFEDCLVLDECFQQFNGSWESICSYFELRRRPQTDAIAALSKQHLHDLQDTMGSQDFVLRSRVETRLTELFPDYYRSLYGMVAFTCMPYTEALQLDASHRDLIDGLVLLPQVREALDDPATIRIINCIVARHRLLAKLA
jgi:kynurenine 3-monooxygenase